MGNIVTTVAAMAGGVTAIAGASKRYRIEYTGTYALADKLLLTMTDTQSGLVERAGYGPITGKNAVFLLTYANKMNALANTQWFFSALDAPTEFNYSLIGGNANIELANKFATPENLLALAPYQGRMAIFGRNTTFISLIDADPAQYKVVQTLGNTGTLAALSVQPLGELDVFFLNGTGIRSLRVRDNTLNAFVGDIGSPIDLLVQEKLAAASATERAAACGIVDPASGRYWLFLKDTIYVISQFQSAKVTAWSTYAPTYATGAQAYVSFRNMSPVSVWIKLGMVNDPAHATATIGIPGLATQTDIAPANYLWVYAADGTTLLLSYTIPGGILFRGLLTMDAFAVGITPTSNQTAFVPQKFFTLDGQVFARTADAIVAYGGTTGEVYDNAVASLTTPWLDGDSSDVTKRAESMNVSMQALWHIYASMDYISEGIAEVAGPQSTPTYDGGLVGFHGVGTHFAFRAATNAASRAVLSALSLKY